MTPFSAKGLEFEHTFLISLTNKIWNSSKGGQRMISMPMNLKFTNIEDEGEDTRKRLLFVAMTRAKTHLYLTNFSSDFSGKNAPTLAFLDEREESGEMRTKILPENYQKVANLENLSPKIEDLQINWHEFYAPKTAQMRELLRPRIENFKLSPTNLNAFTDVEYGSGPRGFYENSILCFPESYGASATLGTLVHDSFNFIQDKINAGETPKFETLQKKFQEKVAKYPLSESEKSEIAERFNRIFIRVFEAGLEKFKAGNIAEKSFSSAGVMVGDALLTGKIDLIQIDKNAKKITVLDYKTGSIPLGKNGQINRGTSKIHKYEQQLYFYKILIENTPEFAGFKVEKGVLEFVEPSKKTWKGI
jgi:DNA helicase-2/ATP-dependent DNA helicase PcrA